MICIRDIEPESGHMVKSYCSSFLSHIIVVSKEKYVCTIRLITDFIHSNYSTFILTDTTDVSTAYIFLKN